jgi:GNAT superfamily N-acetyltransferase
MPGNADVKILLNPNGSELAIGTGFLQQCFGSRWTDAMYRWYLQRPFAGEPTDRLILTDGTRALAGCGLAYRRLRLPDGIVQPVSIVVSAATLPDQRGRGYYAQILHAAIERSAQRHCTALLGFVTADNPTGRGLQRLGATAVPSTYLVSPRSPRFHRTALLQIRAATPTIGWPTRADTRARDSSPAVHFYYPEAAMWRSQMLERPHTVEALHVGTSCRALLECAGDTDRLQWFDGPDRERPAAIAALAARAFRAQRRFFTYSTRKEDSAAAPRLGLRAHPGFLMALAVEARHLPLVRGWASLAWDVQSGDRL